MEEKGGERKGECKSEIKKSKLSVTDTCVSSEVVKGEGGREKEKKRKRYGRDEKEKRQCKSEIVKLKIVGDRHLYK